MMNLYSQEITCGYGDYVLYSQSQEIKTPVSEELLEKFYTILEGQRQKWLEGAYQNRTEILRHEVKKWDPNLEITFLPKTLIELIYLVEEVKEDLDRGEKCCKLSDYSCGKSSDCYHPFLMTKQWHEFKGIANKLNTRMVSLLPAEGNHLKGREIQEIAKKCLDFFYDLPLAEKKRLVAKSPGQFIISNPECQTKLLESIVLECSTLAQNHLFIYRGGDVGADQTQVEEKPYSLSFGTSWFAGSLLDGGATAIQYGLQKDREGYIIPIPYADVQESIFYFPITSTLQQLCSSGEDFHVRTKAPIDHKEIGGYFGVCNRAYDRLKEGQKSRLSQYEIEQKWKEVKNQAIVVFPRTRIESKRKRELLD